MEDEEEVAEPFKVFVSRIPLHWTEQLFEEHFVTLAFGRVKRVELFTLSRGSGSGSGSSKKPIQPIKYCYTFKNDGSCDNVDCQYAPCNGVSLERVEVAEQDTNPVLESIGSGLVVFEDKEGMQNALDQKSLHLARRIIKISPYLDQDSRDSKICYAWTQFRCKHGDDCKFVHEGDGAIERHSQPYRGRAFQCLSFRTKGKCSKGDACQFLHVEANGDGKRKIRQRATETKDADADIHGNGNGDSVKKGLCNMFKKKGKCRKGDRCPYSHAIMVPKQCIQDELESNGVSKKRKIDGKYLVEKRTGTGTKIKFDD